MVALASHTALRDLQRDNDLERRVRIYLATQARPALRTVEVFATAGVVTLRGRVPSFYEKQLSLHLAARVAGVRRLEDELIVHEAARVSFPALER